MKFEIKWPEKKIKINDISSEEIAKWKEQMEEKIIELEDKGVSSSIRFYTAAKEILPGNLNADCRREVEYLLLKLMSPKVREMIKVESLKVVPKKVFTPEQLKWMGKSAQRKIWHEERRAGQSEEDSDLI